MKLKLTTIVSVMILVCASCTTNRGLQTVQDTHRQVLQDTQYQPRFSWPCIIDNSVKSWDYFCSTHYEYLSSYKVAKKRKICTCELADSIIRSIVLGTKVRGGATFMSIPSIQCILFYDSSFVSNYILPLFEKGKDRKLIEYTLSNANDSTFNNIIDFEHKVMINEDACYYPIKCKKMVSVRIGRELKWLKDVFPQEKWIYCRDCYSENVIDIELLIPLLEMKED